MVNNALHLTPGEEEEPSTAAGDKLGREDCGVLTYEGQLITYKVVGRWVAHSTSPSVALPDG